jgi:conjugative relaxase-like TrwC/TraI family protein
VLSISPLRVGSEAYQLSGVAQSLDDYYSGRGEAAGSWAGRGAEHLGLSGEVSSDDLRAVLAGMAPGGGGLGPNGEAIRPHPRRVPGFDFTFKAPKSVSVLWAVTDDPRIQGAIIEAYESALRDTVAWMEREVFAVRRGTGNAKFLADLNAVDPAAARAARQRVLPGAEVVAATFRHRTSRAGDPLLHWHTLVANMVRGADGRWSAYVHPEAYRASRAAGEMFQALGRERLTTTLGVEWRPGRHVPEIAGVPQALCDDWSKRSKEIEAYLDATGLPDDPGGRQDAVLATRRGKGEVEGERLDAAWKADAIAFGWGPDEAERLISTSAPRIESDIESLWRLPEVSFDHDGTPYLHTRVVTADEWVADLLRRDLCVADATFTRHQLFQAVATRLGEGATMTTLERVAARVLSSSETVPIESDDDRGPRRWTSRELLAVEQRLVAIYDQHAGLQPVPDEIIEAALAREAQLGRDQIHAVRTLTRSTSPVSVLVGPAGTGKTWALRVAQDAWNAAGYDVIGAAPSAKAAIELADAEIESFTMHALQRRWDEGHGLPTPRTVLVIDETSMASTRDLEPLVRAVTSTGGRVVLVGDHHQLPEIQAGGGLAAAVRRCAPAAVTQLHTNRRQKVDWEKAALRELRNGSVAAAVAEYRDHERVLVAPDRQSLVMAAAQRWFDARADGHEAVLMAGTNDLVEALNRAVRDNLVAMGALPEAPVATFAGTDFRVGDRVVFRQNWWIDREGQRSERIANGQGGVVADAHDGHLIVRRDRDGGYVTFDADYLQRGSVGLGYARTTHRAQGGSWDIAIGVGLDGLYREAAYTQLSRARHGNWLVLTAPEIEQITSELARHDSRGIPLPSEQIDLEQDLVDRINRSRAKLMAIARDPDSGVVSQLADRYSFTELDRRARRSRAVERYANHAVGIDPRTLDQAVQRAQRTAEHVAVGQKVKAHDRHNIGVVTAVDDLTGRVEVRFRSEGGNEAARFLDWANVEILTPDDPPQRVLPHTAQARIDQLVHEAGETITRWNSCLQRHGVDARDPIRFERARGLVLDRAASALSADRPDWLTRLLGTRPGRPTAAAVWDAAVRELADYRLRTELEPTTHGVGLVPNDPALVRRWQSTSRHLLEARKWLSGDRDRPVLQWTRARSHSELMVRRGELDEILDSAPPDQRDLIQRLRRDGQLPLEETARALQDSLDAQGARREWILAHWPHVVEHAEISRALADGTWGPELPPLLDDLGSDAAPDLAEALADGNPWIETALSRLVGSRNSWVDDTTRTLLSDIAAYRHQWNVTSPDPLGDRPRDLAQAQEYNRLVDYLDRHWGGHQLAEIVDTDLVDVAATPTPGRLPFDEAVVGLPATDESGVAFE